MRYWVEPTRSIAFLASRVARRRVVHRFQPTCREQPLNSTDPYIGEICAVAFDYAPPGWAVCDGSLLSIASHTALFSLIGIRFGGDGVSNFALPDLRGRAAVGSGQGPNLQAVALGQRLGAEGVALNEANLPPHSHGAVFSSEGVRQPAYGGKATLTDPTGAIAANAVSEDGTALASFAPAALASTGMAPVPVSGNVQIMATGGGVPVTTRSPGLGLTFLIAIEGLYPPRGQA
jgi:microcystin-dependent protein